MKKYYKMTDGISKDTWKEIEIISRNYPKEIRFANGTQAKIAMLRFYLDPIDVKSPAPYERMEAGRMLTIAYKIYKDAEGDVIKNLSLKIIHKVLLKMINSAVK